MAGRSRVKRIDYAEVPLAGGEVLGARIWLPHDAHETPVPAIVDYHPYRSCDASVIQDEAIYASLADRGFACVKLDVRGTANSSGVHPDQFSEAYWLDCAEALDWIASQPWCSGRTGMTGLSWPAHAALLVATRRPKSLGAILPVDGADDRYLNRYQGGCLLGYAAWHGMQLSGMHLRPPLPWVVGDKWRSIWLDRLEAYQNYFELWAAHPTFNAYWHPGSAATALDQIQCPVLIAVGAADTGYVASVPRFLKSIPDVRVVMGPGGHCFPQAAIPGPAYDFVDLAARWFGWTLKGEGPSWESGPAITAYLVESHAPDPAQSKRPGRWVSIDTKSLDTTELTFGLHYGRLQPGRSGSGVASVRSPMTTGAGSGEWMPWYPTGPGPNLPEDQREADGNSLCFDSDPLNADVDILGASHVRLRVSSDCQTGQIACRICDVSPEGASNRITYGFLNLSHREGNDVAEAVEPGKFYDVELELPPAGWRVKAGNRIRLALSTNYFPIVWPAPDHATLSFDLEGSSLSIPAPANLADCPPPAGLPVVAPFRTPATTIEPTSSVRHRAFNAATRVLETVVEENSGTTSLDEQGLALGHAFTRRYTIRVDDPTSASCAANAHWTMARGEWSVRIDISSKVTADRGHFTVVTTVDAFENEQNLFSRAFNRLVPRGTA